MAASRGFKCAYPELAVCVGFRFKKNGMCLFGLLLKLCSTSATSLGWRDGRVGKATYSVPLDVENLFSIVVETFPDPPRALIPNSTSTVPEKPHSELSKVQFNYAPSPNRTLNSPVTVTEVLVVNPEATDTVTSASALMSEPSTSTELMIQSSWTR